MLIFWPISSLGDAYKRYLSDAYKQKHVGALFGIPPPFESPKKI